MFLPVMPVVGIYWTRDPSWAAMLRLRYGLSLVDNCNELISDILRSEVIHVALTGLAVW